MHKLNFFHAKKLSTTLLAVGVTASMLLTSGCFWSTNKADSDSRSSSVSSAASVSEPASSSPATSTASEAQASASVKPSESLYLLAEPTEVLNTRPATPATTEPRSLESQRPASSTVAGNNGSSQPCSKPSTQETTPATLPTSRPETPGYDPDPYYPIYPTYPDNPTPTTKRKKTELERAMEQAKELYDKWHYSKYEIISTLTQYSKPKLSKEIIEEAISKLNLDFFKAAKARVRQALDMPYGYSRRLLKLSLSSDAVRFTPDEITYAIESVTQEEWNKEALKSAKSYLSSSGFSRDRLRRQLTFNKDFTQEEADYAVEHIKADWNKEALEAAQYWLESQPLSQKDLLFHLVNTELFTKEQAQYALDNLKTDWNQEAIRYIKKLLKRGISYKRILRELRDENRGFTVSQAEYAEKHFDWSKVDWNQQALMYATSYIKSNAISKKELEEGLKFEEFTPEQIKYALDHVNADWNQAIINQIEKLLQEGHSYNGIMKIITNKYRGFEKSEVEYAKKNFDWDSVDWNEQAVMCANSILSRPFGVSKKGLFRQLTEDPNLFTTEQATYALNHVEANWNEEALGALTQKTKIKLWSKNQIQADLEKLDLFTKEEVAYAMEHISIDWNQYSLEVAQEKIKYFNSSKKQFIEVLESGLFTDDEISYIEKNLKVDCNEKALKAAKEYQQHGDPSTEDIKERLDWLGFTPEEIQYAIEHLNDPEPTP